MKQINNSISKLMVGYVRVSTKKQTKGTSIDSQKDAINKYCMVHNIELNKVFVDSGLSAYKNRPNFEKMIKYVLINEHINGVICNDLTRFGRSTVDLLVQINQIEKAGKSFITVKDNFDTSTKTGKLLLTVLSAIADFESKTIHERMQSGREWAKIHGTKSGKPMHRPEKYIDWKKVDELRKLGLSWTKTAHHVNVSTPTLINRAKKENHY